MEDENGLELSLGLSFGSSFGKPKSKNVNSSNTSAEDVGRSGKMLNEFNSVFDANPHKPDSVNGEQRTNSSKSEENFFSDLSTAKEDNASLSLKEREFWVANSNKPVEIEEDKQLEIGNKRKMSFDEIIHQKKHENDVHHADLHDSARKPHTSMTDGSAAENEDVADSGSENSNSRLILHHGDSFKGFMTVGVSSNAPQGVREVAESSAIDLNGEKRLTGSSEKDFKHANVTHGASFSFQQLNMINMPYPSPVKESNSVCAPGPQLSGVMPASTGSLPVMFGYPSVLHPMLDKDNALGLVSHSQPLHQSISGRGPPNSGRPLEIFNGDGKQHVTEEGSSSQPEDVKGSSSTKAKVVSDSDQSTGDASLIDFSSIKPGLAADVNFGGGGSCANLPWVSTTGSGPNRRTISGVTYRYNTNLIRIVCACHGSHMTPEEFVRHANEDQANPEGSTVLGKVENGNSAASAHR